MNLDDVFRCPAIGRYLSVGACLRRQREQRLVTVVVREASEDAHHTQARITEQRPAGAAYPGCADCELGRKHAAEVTPEPPAPARPRPVARSVIWSGAAPDVPLPPPPSGVSRRVPTFLLPGPAPRLLRTPQPTSSTDKPASPAEEDEMSKHPPCPECKSGSRHKQDCSRRPGSKAPLREVVKRAGTDAGAAIARAIESAPSVQVPRLSDEQLGILVAEIIADLKRREVDAQARLGKIRELREKLGEAA